MDEIIHGLSSILIILIIFGPFLGLIFSLIISGIFARRIILGHKPIKSWIILVFSIFIFLFSALLIAPNSVRQKIVEWQLSPILLKETPLEETISFLMDKKIYHILYDKKYCTSEAMKMIGACNEDLPQIMVHVPIKPSLIKGTAIIRLKYDQSDKLKEYNMRIGWTFL